MYYNLSEMLSKEHPIIVDGCTSLKIHARARCPKSQKENRDILHQFLNWLVRPLKGNEEQKNEIPRFFYPDKEVIKRSRATTNSYTHPLIKVVFWERFKSGFNYLVERMRDQSICQYECILEIGTSYGFLLPSLCKIAKTVIGTDIKPTFDFCYNLTLQDIQKSCPNLELKTVDVLELGKLITISPDVIIAYSVLEHVENQKKAVKEIHNCLTSGDIFLCELPIENLFYKIARKLIGYKEAHRGFDYRETKQILNDQFIEIKTWNVPYGLPLFNISVYQKV